MAGYQGTLRNDRAKALAGVLLVHVALGFALLSGLNVRNVQQVVETLKTFDVRETPPPPPQPPPPRERAERAKEE
jgi:protein TonB